MSLKKAFLPVYLLFSNENNLVAETVLETPYPNMFVIGDAADAFGAIPAGHTAYYQVRSSRSSFVLLSFVLMSIVV